MASNDEQQNRKDSANTAAPRQSLDEAPKYTMYTPSRIQGVVELSVYAQTIPVFSPQHFETGRLIIDMCTYRLNEVTTDPYHRRTLFEKAEWTIEQMALTLIDRLGLSVEDVPFIDGLERSFQNRTLRAPSNTWNDELKRRYTCMMRLLGGLVTLPADSVAHLNIVKALLWFVTGGEATIPRGPDVPPEVFQPLLGPLEREWRLHMADFGMLCLLRMAKFVSFHYGGQTVALFGKHIPVQNFAPRAGDAA